MKKLHARILFASLLISLALQSCNCTDCADNGTKKEGSPERIKIAYTRRTSNAYYEILDVDGKLFLSCSNRALVPINIDTITTE